MGKKYTKIQFKNLPDLGEGDLDFGGRFWCFLLLFFDSFTSLTASLRLEAASEVFVVELLLGLFLALVLSLFAKNFAVAFLAAARSGTNIKLVSGSLSTPVFDFAEFLLFFAVVVDDLDDFTAGCWSESESDSELEELDEADDFGDLALAAAEKL